MLEALKRRVTAIGKTASFLASVSFGASASGFIMSFASMVGFSSVSPDWIKGLVYTGAALLGVNVAYRMWRVTQAGAPAGLKMIFGDNNSSQIVSWTKAKKIGVGLSFFAGATYGGMGYLGISELVHLDHLWWKVSSGVMIIGSTFVAAGSLFSYAWLSSLNEGTLIKRHRFPKSKIYISAEVISALLSVSGLAIIMFLGSLGLAKSIAADDRNAQIAGGVIALVGFFGEAPFSIQQGRLLIKKLSKIREGGNGGNDNRLSTYSRVASTLSTVTYAAGYFAGSYANIVIPTAERLLVASGSSYLALVSSLEDEPETEGDQQLLLNDEENSIQSDAIGATPFSR